MDTKPKTDAEILAEAQAGRRGGIAVASHTAATIKQGDRVRLADGRLADVITVKSSSVIVRVLGLRARNNQRIDFAEIAQVIAMPSPY